MLAPIALYPDPLLTQILMASTYPLEVVKAARWARAHPGLQGEEAVRAVADEDWDPSVKSLVAFPRVLQMMDERIDWTQQLGEAFLAQEPYVLETVQQLRRRAYAAGNLTSNSDVVVSQEGSQIVIVPANPQVIYVPYYDPWVVYGTWWWPNPPIWWAPWPGYVYPRTSVTIVWGGGIPITTNFFFGIFDWHAHRVDVRPVRNFYYRPRVVHTAPTRWQHEPAHRYVPYRRPELRQRYPEPRRVEPRRVAPRRVEPRRVEPQRTEPQRVEPRRVEPQRTPQQPSQPQRVQPQRTEPQRTEPRRVEPRRVEPQRTQPQRTQPQPQRTQPQRTQPQPQRTQPQRPEPRREEPQSRGAPPRAVERARPAPERQRQTREAPRRENRNAEQRDSRDR